MSVGLDWRPDGPGWVRIPLRKTLLRNFGNFIYPALPVSFGGDTKKIVKAVGPFYLVSMTEEVKISHQSALECVTPPSQGITFEKARRATNRSLKMTIWSLGSDLCYDEKISARGRHYNTIRQGAPFHAVLTQPPDRSECLFISTEHN